MTLWYLIPSLYFLFNNMSFLQLIKASIKIVTVSLAAVSQCCCFSCGVSHHVSCWFERQPSCRLRWSVFYFSSFLVISDLASRAAVKQTLSCGNKPDGLINTALYGAFTIWSVHLSLQFPPSGESDAIQTSTKKNPGSSYCTSDSQL